MYWRKIEHELRLDFPIADPILVKMVLSLEDRRFNNHKGVDFRSFARAIFFYIIGKSRSGASTIDMQLVRTITGQYQKTYIRKLIEIILARKMNKFFTKEEIISCYLNIAYTGEGLVGMEKASNSLFFKNVNLCTEDEKAILAAVLLSPIPKHRSLFWWERVRRRARKAKTVSKLLSKRLTERL